MNQENVAAVSGLPAVVSAREAPSSTLGLELRLHGDVALLRCRGRLVYREESSELTTIVSDLLGLTRRLVVDLAGVERVDSAGLGELVMLHMWADGMGYAVAFASPNARVRDLLELTNLTSMLDVHQTLHAALKAVVERPDGGRQTSPVTRRPSQLSR
jgi:anti-sigma B factor antagonist